MPKGKRGLPHNRLWCTSGNGSIYKLANRKFSFRICCAPRNASLLVTPQMSNLIESYGHLKKAMNCKLSVFERKKKGLTQRKTRAACQSIDYINPANLHTRFFQVEATGCFHGRCDSLMSENRLQTKIRRLWVCLEQIISNSWLESTNHHQSPVQTNDHFCTSRVLPPNRAFSLGFVAED